MSVERNNPYVGPRSFRTGDKLYGRDWEMQEIRDVLIARRIALFYSPSGAGKTSLIHAALIPALENERFQVLPPIRVGMDPPSEVLNANCAFNRYVLSAIISLGGIQNNRANLVNLCSVDLPTYLEQLFQTLTGQADADPPRDPVLIFDQFEEILTVDPLDRAAKEEFFKQLGKALDTQRFWVLFAMREDYIASLDPYLVFIPTRLKTHFRLERLDRDAALSALIEPAAAQGVTFADGVAESLIDDLLTLPMGKSEFVEPVQLQVVARDLWKHWRKTAPPGSTVITAEHVKSFGNVEQALGNFYDDCIRETVQNTDVSERELRRWFDEKMITPAGTRGIVYKDKTHTEGIPNTAVDVLDTLHIIHIEPRAGADWCEISHDGFVAPIKESNRVWEQAYREELIRKRFRMALYAIIPAALVLIGLALLLWRNARTDSQRVQKTAQAELATAAVAAQSTATVQAAQAAVQARAAQLDTMIANANRAISDGESGKAIALALAADELIKQDAALATPRNQARLYNLLARATYNPNLRSRQEMGEESGVYSVFALAPDGHTLVFAASGQETTPSAPRLTVWDTQGGMAQPRSFDLSDQLLFGPYSQILDIVFMPDGGSVLVVANSVVLLWDLDAGQVVRRFEPDQGDLLSSVAVVPPNHRSVIAGGTCGSQCDNQGVLILWDLETGAMVRRFDTGPAPVSDVAVSPDGYTVYVVCNDGLLFHLGLKSGAALGDNQVAPPPVAQFAPQQFSLPPVTPTSLPPSPYHLALSADGETALVTSPDAPGMFVWNVTTDGLKELEGHTAAVWSVAISSDGRSALSAAEDGTVILWDLEQQRIQYQFAPYSAPVWDIAFGPDEQTAIGAAGDNRLLVWDLRAGNQLRTFPGHGAWAAAVAFGGDSPRAVSGGCGAVVQEENSERCARGEIILLDTDTGNASLSGVGSTGVRSVAISPDGRWVLAGMQDGTVNLFEWDAAAKPTPISLNAHNGPVTMLAFRPGGETFVTVGCARMTQIDAANTMCEYDALSVWDLQSRDRLQTYPMVELNTLSDAIPVIIALGPGGEQVVARTGGNITLYNLTGAGLQQAAFFESGLPGPISAAASGPNQVAVGYCLNDRCTQTELRVFQVNPPLNVGSVPLNSRIVSLTFSADGKKIAAGLLNGTLIWWDAATLEELYRTQGHAGPATGVAFNPDGDRMLSVPGTDQAITLWQIGSFEQLVQWTRTNRYFTLTCADRQQAGLACEIPPVTGELVFGKTAQGELDAAGSTAWTFQNTTQRTISISVASQNTDYVLIMRNPGGDKPVVLAPRLVSGQDKQVFEHVLAQQGVYTLALYAGENGLQYGLALTDLQQTTPTPTVAITLPPTLTSAPTRLLDITYGQTVTGAVPPESIDYWTFEGRAGDVVSLTMQEENNGATALVLVGPDNTTLDLADNSRGEESTLIDAVDLPEDGSYIVQAYGSGGTYTLTLTNLLLTTPTPGPTATPLPPHRLITFGETAAGSLEPGGLDVWSFEGAAGRAISVALSFGDPNQGPTLILQAPDGSQPAIKYGDGETNVIQITDFLLPENGSYAILVSADSGIPVDYRLTVVDLSLMPPTLTPTVLVPPTQTIVPSPTPAAMRTAQAGDQRGEVPVGGREVWFYMGCAGEILTISVNADDPVNFTPQTQIQAGMLDAVVILSAPDGTEFAVGDDIAVAVDTNARIENQRLPANGLYTIDVRGFDFNTGGAYTLTITSSGCASQ